MADKAPIPDQDEIKPDRFVIINNSEKRIMTRIPSPLEEMPEHTDGSSVHSKQLYEQLRKSLSEEIGQEASKLKDQIADIIAAKDTAYEENLIKRTSREIASLSLHLLEKESEVMELKVREADYINQIASLEAERDQLRNTVNLVFSSTSWKLTAPLRKIVRLLKR